MKQITISKTEIKATPYNFAVNPEYTTERSGNYELRDKISKKWANCNDVVDGCGNVHNDFYFDIPNQTFIFSEQSLHCDSKFIPLYKVMSPALLMYRLIATFFGSPKCEDRYKSIWEYNLLHKATGKGISFSEWKGAIGFWLPETDSNKLNAKFKADLIELMNYLISNECTHPYDGLVAGSVA